MKSKFNPVAVVLGLSGLFFVIFVGISIALFMGKGRGGAKNKPALFSEGGVAVLEINGVIMDSKKALKQIEKFEESKDVKALVVRINSPGGAVAPSQEIHDALKAFSKPVVASMSSVAASGGYYIAVAAKKIFANAGTITGSIGVIMEFANLEKLYEWAKVKRYAIKTGKFKDAGADFREMTPEEKELLQGMVDNVLGQFKGAVAEGRHLKVEQVTPLADGRIFSGEQAKAVKLVDELGGFPDAVKAAAEMAGLKGKPNLIYDNGKKKFLEMLLEEGRDDDEDSRSFISRVLSQLGVGGATASRVSLDLGLAPGIYWLWKGAR